VTTPPRVTGIGGVFFKAAIFRWRDDQDPALSGATAGH